MRRPSPRMFPNAVTVYPVVFGAQGKPGDRTKTWPAGVDLRASVQPGAATRQGAQQGATRSNTDAVAYFAADPVVKPDDRLVWHQPGLADRTFGILGPASSEGGGGGSFSVRLAEVK